MLVSELLEFLGDKRHAIQCILKRALGYEQEKLGPSLNTKKLYTCRRSTEDITANLTLAAT